MKLDTAGPIGVGFPALEDAGLSSLIERTPDAVLVADDDRRYIYANGPACRLLGLNFSGLCGRRIEDFAAPGFREDIEAHWHDFLDMGVQSGAYQLLSADATIHDVEFTAVARIRPGFHVSFLRDVTQQRKIEHAKVEAQRVAELALRSGRMGSWVWYLNSSELVWNDTLEEIFGTNPAKSNASYGHFLNLIHPDDREQVRQAIGETLRSGLEYEIEYRVQHETRGLRWIADRGQVLFGPAGERIGIAGVCWDVTQTRLVEQQRQEQVRELARSNAELNRFAYVASHDLKEPLRNMGALSQLLLEQTRHKLSDDEIETAEFIVKGAQKMAALIDGLLRYSQASSQRDLLLVNADINELLAQALQNLEVSVAQTGAVVEHERLPVIKCSPLDVVQLFQNLIGNAIKYCREAPPRVCVWAQDRDGEWMFAVRDNGIGIDPQHHALVFGMFERLHGHEYSGTGLGLAICQAIVDKHKGRIWLESAEGKGSTFYFTLPK